MIQAAILATLLDEASVRSIRAAIDAGKVTCVQVVQHALDRIERLAGKHRNVGPPLLPSSRANRRRGRRVEG